MVWFRKWVIPIYRFLGIPLSLAFMVWGVSGIAMMYAHDMPGLSPEARLERLPPLNMDRVRITPSQAVDGTGLGLINPSVTLLTVMDRPAYRFAGRETVTVFADTGERLIQVGGAGAIRIAGSFMDLPRERMRYAGVLDAPDQWTIDWRGRMPLHKIRVDDDAGTELYVSPQIAEVVVLTTRRTRALAWISAIPHWFYFAPLALNGPLREAVVFSLAGFCALFALIGIVTGIIGFAGSGPFRWRHVPSHIPYTGGVRWHLVAGSFFGIFMLTWVISGALSLGPWGRAPGPGTGEGIPQSLSGGAADLGSFFQEVDPEEWNAALGGRLAKEVEFVNIQGDPYYLIRGIEEHPLLIAANPGIVSENLFENLFDIARSPLAIRQETFSIESLMSRVSEGNPDVPIVASELLSEYDAYYYSQDGARPLPVLRVKFGDTDSTWFYIDPRLSQITGRFTRFDRVERRVYNGFHSLDFSFWYYNRPLWDIGVIVLSLGCLIFSGLGLFVGIKGVLRYLTRAVAGRV